MMMEIVVTIDQIDVTLDRYKIKEDNGMWHWYEEVFEGYAFEYGEKAEFSNDKEDWCKRIYISYYSYLCVANGYEKKFRNGEQYSFLSWRYARPIQKKHTIIIDNKEIEISEESYQKLKESLCL